MHSQFAAFSICNLGSAVAQLVEALRYKPEGHGSLRLFNNLVIPAAL